MKPSQKKKKKRTKIRTTTTTTTKHQPTNQPNQRKKAVACCYVQLYLTTFLSPNLRSVNVSFPHLADEYVGFLGPYVKSQEDFLSFASPSPSSLQLLIFATHLPCLYVIFLTHKMILKVKQKGRKLQKC